MTKTYIVLNQSNGSANNGPVNNKSVKNSLSDSLINFVRSNQEILFLVGFLIIIVCFLVFYFHMLSLEKQLFELKSAVALVQKQNCSIHHDDHKILLETLENQKGIAQNNNDIFFYTMVLAVYISLWTFRIHLL